VSTPSSSPAVAPHEARETDLYRELFAAYADALVVADRRGVVVRANPAAAALLGYPIDELVGLEIDALVPDAVRPRHAANRAAFGREPQARAMGLQTELVARRKDGSEVVVEIALSPVQNHGEPLVVAAIRDIGAYPRMQQALRRAHYSEHLANLGRLAVDARDSQSLLDQVSIVAAGALAVEVATVYLLEANRLELRVASAVGHLAGEGLGELLANRPDTSLGFVLAQGRSIIVSDYATERRFSVPPSYRDARLTSALAVPLSDRGRTIGVLVVRSRAARDFGDDEVRFLESLAHVLASSLQRARSDEALNHAQRLESVGQLTGGIAHDFNNLLTVIQGNLQVLDELPSLAGDADARQLVAAAARASRRAAELTGKLLAFSRRQVLQPQVVDIGALLRSLADMLSRTLDQHVRITVALPVERAEVVADPGQLESALLNIAINARDAMPQGGVLRFRVNVHDDVPHDLGAEFRDVEASGAGVIAIAVQDNGSGMSDEAKERAFEPFFTTKASGRGTGLGLSTVYGFVKQSNGAIAIDSALGQGTTVTLYLPRPTVAQASVAEADRRADAVLTGLAVLLVEDDAEVRALMQRFLATLGCETTAAASGEQALLALGTEARFDLLLTDIALGEGMRGTELAARAQQLLPMLSILLMSGYSSELLDADRDSPASWELLRKPCSREELAQAIARTVAAVARAGA
jgi:PAS domain S-box-containing protein